MSDESLLPFLLRLDPLQRAEGSIAPLGLYAIADAMGVRLTPGTRERQSRPGFVTLALVGTVQIGVRGFPPNVGLVGT